MEDKKLPLLGDVRDESAETMRLVLEPKTRGVEPEVLMETLFRATALETPFPAQHERAGRDPHAAGDGAAARCCAPGSTTGTRCWCAASSHRLAAIERRLEVLDGYLLVYLNLDEVIRIIREEDEPKPRLMARFDLTDVQAEAILNMRLRSRCASWRRWKSARSTTASTKERKDLQRAAGQ